jgi:hypothetical protein
MPKGIPKNGINKGWFNSDLRPYKKTGITKMCPCGNSFYCEKNRLDRKKYCSILCRCNFHPTGAKFSQEAKDKISLARKGFKFTDEQIQKLRDSHLGKIQSDITKEKNRQAQLKRWDKIGRKKIEDLQRYNNDAKDRRSSAYGAWRKQVWKRDNYTCKIANKDCLGRIEAHHILGWSSYPELRYRTNNGITLCHAHHPKKRAEEKRLASEFQALVSVSKEQF